MSYEVKSQILGFENILKVDIHEVDALFSTMIDADGTNISFSMVNPYLLREYSFDLPLDIKILLDIKEDSNVSVYNTIVIQKPLEESTVNFLAPIIVNNDTKTIAQAILDNKKHPEFGMTEPLESFRDYLE